MNSTHYDTFALLYLYFVELHSPLRYACTYTPPNTFDPPLDIARLVHDVESFSGLRPPTPPDPTPRRLIRSVVDTVIGQ